MITLARSGRWWRSLAALVVMLGGLVLGVASAWAQDDAATDAGFVDVVEVSGLLDPVLADFIEQAVAEGAESGARWVVLQVNSPGSVVSDERLLEVARTIADAPVRVAAWIGPSGSKAEGELAQLVAVADEIGISVGSRFGDTGELVIPADLLDPEVVEIIATLETSTVGADRAAGLGLARSAPTIGDFLIGLDDFEVEIDNTGDELRSLALTQVR